MRGASQHVLGVQLLVVQLLATVIGSAGGPTPDGEGINSGAAGDASITEREVDKAQLSSSSTNIPCRCLGHSCDCDLAAEVDLDAVFLPLGYDLCVFDSACEACADREQAYCLPTGGVDR